MNIVGIDYAFKENSDSEIPTVRDGFSSYILTLGNWASSKLDKGLGVYQFQFAHPQGSPFIENILIKKSGMKNAFAKSFNKQIGKLSMMLCHYSLLNKFQFFKRAF